MKIKRRDNLAVNSRPADYTGKKVYCPEASTLGFTTRWATPGCWLTYAQPVKSYDNKSEWEDNVVGRMFASIESPEVNGGKPMLAVVALSDDLTFGMLRWVKPENVTRILAPEDPGMHYATPRRMLDWISGEGFERAAADPKVMLRLLNYGTVSDMFVEHADRHAAAFKAGVSPSTYKEPERESDNELVRELLESGYAPE